LSMMRTGPVFGCNPYPASLSTGALWILWSRPESPAPLIVRVRLGNGRAPISVAPPVPVVVTACAA
jgi:hypothetical protein